MLASHEIMWRRIHWRGSACGFIARVEYGAAVEGFQLNASTRIGSLADLVAAIRPVLRADLPAPVRIGGATSIGRDGPEQLLKSQTLWDQIASWVP